MRTDSDNNFGTGMLYGRWTQQRSWDDGRDDYPYWTEQYDAAHPRGRRAWPYSPLLEYATSKRAYSRACHRAEEA